jgi:hypothetical protein
MINKYPLVVLVLTFAVLGLSSWLGATRFQRFREQINAMREEYNVIQGATLTLLGLLIGFTFSMAIGRYDQRKNYEEEEANAIGTEYLRADLLPAADAAKVRTLLRSYVDQRMLFYSTRNPAGLEKIATETARLQAELWSAVSAPAVAQQTPLLTLVVAGMNDVLNSQGYTQAAWLNRIPFSAWLLVVLIGACSTMLVGIGARRSERVPHLVMVLPLVISLALFLIADIDSPRGGIIRIAPQNLQILAQSMQAS